MGHTHRQSEAEIEPVTSRTSADEPVHDHPHSSFGITYAHPSDAQNRSWRGAHQQIYAIAFIGFLLSLLSFWPGFMEFDSFDQYGQAIGQEPLNDWHPVIMALLWKLVISVHDGPQPMLLLQMTLYWSGFLYLALQILRRTDRAALAIGAVVAPYFPFLLNFSGVLWKDTQLALAFFWACLIMAFARRSVVSVGISLSLIYYGLAVRHNGITAALPLLLLWSYEFAAVLGLRHQFAPPLTALCAASVLLLLNLAVSDLVTAEKTSPLHHQMLNEIAYIECQSLGPFYVLPSYYGEALTRLSQPSRRALLCSQISSLAATGDTDDIFERKLLKEPDDDDPKILSSWFQTISSKPLEYLRYRFIVYRAFLRPFTYSHPYYTFCNGKETNPYPDRISAEPANPLGLTTLLANYIVFASKWLDLFFRPVFWLATLVVTAGLSLWKRNLPASLVCLSGISYLAAYFLFLPAPDFRYAYWAIFAETLSSFLLLSSSYERPPEPLLRSTGRLC